MYLKKIIDFNFQQKWRDYLTLCKPRVVALMLLTMAVGMLLAPKPNDLSIFVYIFATIGIATASASAAVLNHLIDRHFDAIMRRTQRRPLPQGTVSTKAAFCFALLLAVISMLMLFIFVNTLTAILTLISMFGYAIVYTLYLKHATPQNIVIGGLAGAAPPLLGWTAITNHIDANALLLVLIIFVWTPPHFWALAIYREQDYAEAKIPMMPVTHGIPFTKLQIVLYTILLLIVSVFPYLTGMFGLLYLISALLLGFVFLYYALYLKQQDKPIIAMKTFRYSIWYLMLLFSAMLLDHWIK